MTAARRGVALTPMETRHDVIVRAAQLADELGYEAFAVPEGWGAGPDPGAGRPATTVNLAVALLPGLETVIVAW
jgi:alkanesulfonate monooxygenase SsuD/methylene tetrahydromethanopterin reductase-like flavin-dependent oxidoreductase (luciferase family)